MSEAELLRQVFWGMTRTDMMAVFGKPTDFSRTTKKNRWPSTYKYGDIEFHFGNRWDSPLACVYTENQTHTEGYALVKYQYPSTIKRTDPKV